MQLLQVSILMGELQKKKINKQVITTLLQKHDIAN